MPRSETIISLCPHCGNRIRIDTVKSKGGSRGGWVLECVSCRKPFHQRLVGDIESSRVSEAHSFSPLMRMTYPKARLTLWNDLDFLPNPERRAHLTGRPPEKRPKAMT